MNSWIRFFTFAAFMAVALWTGPSAALEKVSRALPDDDRDDWRGGPTTCIISYYNTCTGWVWVWSGFADGDRVGVNFSNCCGGGFTGQLIETTIFVATSAPSGYGFTGSLDVFAADGNGCPTGPSLGTQSFLPTSLWHIVDYSSAPISLPDSFVMTYTTAGTNNPASIGSDHPATGPTGPQSCGTCFQANRVNHSYAFGTAASPLCPGSTFNDGVCDAQLMWDVKTNCVPTAVESSSWGQLKNLYR